MYRGLIGATSEELGFPELEGPKALLLEDVEEVDLGTRDERLQGLAQRLEMLDVLEEELDEPGLDSGGLGDRLRLRRVGDDVLDSRVSSSAVEGEIVPSSRARQLLGKLGESVSIEADEKGMTLGVGVAVRSDWRDLVMECVSRIGLPLRGRSLMYSMQAELDDLEGVKLGMDLQRVSLAFPRMSTLLIHVLAAISPSCRFRASNRGHGTLRIAREPPIGSRARSLRSRKLVSCSSRCRLHTDRSCPESIALSILTHHHLIESFLPSHPALAIQHLHALEAGGHIPLLISYTSVIRCLLRTDSPPHLVARGWDLYAHTRLVAHPVPDVALYATMIQACSRGPSPSPERAIDLFTEMTGDNRLAPSERAYNGVIRACSRQGSQENYFEALRYMRQMLDANVVPSRHTFHAIFEGAMRHGDLARARWMLVQMMGVGGDASPDANSLGLVFQAYANHVVPKGTKAGGAPVVLKTVDAPRVQVEDFNAPPAHERSTGTNAIIELLGESSLSFPGPLPQSSEELLAEAKNLMSQCVHPSSLPPLSESLTSNDLLPPFDSPVFPSLVPTTFLLNSYLNLLSSHADLDPAAHFFNTAYARLGVAKNRFTFEKMMTRCEVGRNKTVAMRFATETFKEWRAWDPTPEKVKTEQVEEEGGEKVEPEVPRSVLHAGKTGTNTSKMWASMIRSLARYVSFCLNPFPPTLTMSCSPQELPSRQVARTPPDVHRPPSSLAPPRRRKAAAHSRVSPPQAAFPRPPVLLRVPRDDPFDTPRRARPPPL